MKRYFLLIILTAIIFYALSTGLYIYADSKKILYTLSDDQVYQSMNGGQSWEGLYIESDSLIHYNDMAIDCKNQIIYIATGTGILKSTDRGRNWQKIYPAGRNDSVNVIALDYHNLSSVYAITAKSLYYSNDAGKNWKSLTLPSRDIYFISVFSSEGKIYVAGHNRIYKSTDNGIKWNSINNNISKNAFIEDLAGNPDCSSELYLSTSEGLYYSDNGGNKWYLKSVSTKEYIKTVKVIFCPSNPAVQYMLSVDTKEGGITYLRKSSDRGKNWVTIASKDEIRTVAVNPVNSGNLYYLGYSTLEIQGQDGLFQNIYSSDDSGKNWKELQGILPGTENIKNIYVRPW